MKRTNKQIIKAISIGISAAMALQPVAAFASDAPEAKPDPITEEQNLLSQDVVDASASIAECAEQAEILLKEAEEALKDAKNAYNAEEAIINASQADVAGASFVGGMANGDVVMDGYFSEYVEDKTELNVFKSVSDNAGVLVDEYNDSYNDVSENYSEKVAEAVEALDVSYNELADLDVSNNTGVQVDETQREYDETVAASTKAAKLANAEEADAEAKKAEAAYEDAKALYDAIEDEKERLQGELDALAESSNEDIEAMQAEIDALEARIKMAKAAVDAAKWRLDLANFAADAWDYVGDANVSTVSDNNADIEAYDVSAGESLNVILDAETKLEQDLKAATDKVSGIENDIKELNQQKQDNDKKISDLQDKIDELSAAQELLKHKNDKENVFDGYKEVRGYSYIYENFTKKTGKYSYEWYHYEPKYTQKNKYTDKQISDAQTIVDAAKGKNYNKEKKNAEATSKTLSNQIASKNIDLTGAKAEKAEIDAIKQIAERDIITQDEVLEFLNYEWITVDGLLDMYKALHIHPSYDGKITVNDFTKILAFIESRESGHYNDALNDEQNFEWSKDEDNQYTTSLVYVQGNNYGYGYGGYGYWTTKTTPNQDVINEYLRILEEYGAVTYGRDGAYADDELCMEKINAKKVLEAYLLEESQLASKTLDAKLKKELTALYKAQAANLLADAAAKQQKAAEAQAKFDAELAYLADLKAQLTEAVKKLSNVHYSTIEKANLEDEIALINEKITDTINAVEAAGANAEKAREIADAAMAHALAFVEYNPSNDEEEEEAVILTPATNDVLPGTVPTVRRRATTAATPVEAEEVAEVEAPEEVVIVEEEVPEVEAPEVEAPEVVIEEEEAPQAPAAEKEMSWWWILVVLVLGAAGGELYRRYKIKQNKEEATEK